MNEQLLILYTKTFLVAAAARQTYVDVIRSGIESRPACNHRALRRSFFAYGAARNLPSTILQKCGKELVVGISPI